MNDRANFNIDFHIVIIKDIEMKMPFYIFSGFINGHTLSTLCALHFQTRREQSLFVPHLHILPCFWGAHIFGIWVLGP